MLFYKKNTNKSLYNKNNSYICNVIRQTTIKPYGNTVKPLKMTKTFSQGSNSATLSKWYRMMSNKNRTRNVRYVTEGFCDWFLSKNEHGEYEIIATTTYHSEATVENMYNSNLKKW